MVNEAGAEFEACSIEIRPVVPRATPESVMVAAEFRTKSHKIPLTVVVGYFKSFL